MKILPHPDDKHLEAAEGWIGLGNWKEANEELEKIAPDRFWAYPGLMDTLGAVVNGEMTESFRIALNSQQLTMSSKSP